MNTVNVPRARIIRRNKSVRLLPMTCSHDPFPRSVTVLMKHNIDVCNSLYSISEVVKNKKNQTHTSLIFPASIYNKKKKNKIINCLNYPGPDSNPGPREK